MSCVSTASNTLLPLLYYAVNTCLYATADESQLCTCVLRSDNAIYSFNPAAYSSWTVHSNRWLCSAASVDGWCVLWSLWLSHTCMCCYCYSRRRFSGKLDVMWWVWVWAGHTVADRLWVMTHVCCVVWWLVCVTRRATSATLLRSFAPDHVGCLDYTLPCSSSVPLSPCPTTVRSESAILRMTIINSICELCINKYNLWMWSLSITFRGEKLLLHLWLFP